MAEHERTHVDEQTSKDRMARVGVGGGPANEQTTKAEQDTEKAEREQREGLKAAAERVMRFERDLREFALEGQETPQGRALVDAMRNVAAASDLQHARLMAEAVLTDTPVLKAGPSTARSVQSFPTANSGAAVSTDHLPVGG